MFRFLAILVAILLSCFQFGLIASADLMMESAVSVDKFKPTIKNPQLIEDEALKAFKGQSLQKPVYNLVIFEDEAVNDFKGQTLVKPAYKEDLFDDELVRTAFAGQQLSKPFYRKEIINDEVVALNSGLDLPSKPTYSAKIVDENKEETQVFVACKSKIKTNHYRITSNAQFEDGIKIGDEVEFVVTKDVHKNGKLFIAKNAAVHAIVGNIVPSSSIGAPSELIIEHFVTTDVDGNPIKLVGNIDKKGVNLSPIVYAVAYLGLPFTFGGSMAFMLVPGGQATIKPSQKHKFYCE